MLLAISIIVKIKMLIFNTNVGVMATFKFTYMVLGARFAGIRYNSDL